MACLTQLRIGTEVHRVLVECRGTARVYERFGTHGGFLAVVQLLAALQLGEDDDRMLRSQLLLLALTILSDAITYSRANLAAFAQMPGWESFLHSLELAACAGASKPMASRIAALLMGLATGDVAKGAQHFGAVWQNVRTDAPSIDALRAKLPRRPGSVVHPRAVECALRNVDEANDVHAQLALYAVLDELLETTSRNVVVLARSPLVSRILRAWLAEGQDTLPLVSAWRERMLRTLLADGIRSADDVRAILARLTAAPLHTQLPLLELVLSVAKSAHRPSALVFSASGVPGGGGARIAALDRPFPMEGRSTGYTLVLSLQIARRHGDGMLDLVQLNDRIRLSLDLGTSSLVYSTGHPMPLPRAKLTPGTWHHLVLTHTRAASGTPSTLHVYVDGQRACSPQVPYPFSVAPPVAVLFGSAPGVPGVRGTGGAVWSLGSAMLHDGVVPSSVPLLLSALPPQYKGNLQGALTRFLSYAGHARMQHRLDQLAAVAGPRANSGMPETIAFHALHAALHRAGSEVFPLERFYFHLVAAHTLRSGPSGVLILNQAVPSVEAATRAPHGHARVYGVPTINVPRSVGDAVWAAGGATSLLQICERADSSAALAASVRLFWQLVNETWRLAEDAERLGAYGILGVMLRDKAALLSEDVLSALLDATGVEGLLANVLLYRTVLLDVCLWAQAPVDVQRAYLGHFAVLFGEFGAQNAQKLAKAQLMKRLVYFVRLAPHRSEPLHDALVDAVRAILRTSFSARNIQALMLFLVASIAPWTPPEDLLGTASARTDDARAVPAECAKNALPPAQAAPDTRLERLAVALLHVLVDVASSDVKRLERMARCASAKWLLLLVRPGISRDVAAPALALIAMLTEHGPFLEQWEALGGFRVLERSLPPLWDAPDILPSLWRLLLGPRPKKASMYATYATPLSLARFVHQPAALRVLVLCLAQGLGQESRTALPGSRQRRNSLPPASARPSLADATQRRALLQESVQLLVTHASHPELTRLLLLAPTLLCLFHAMTPILEADRIVDTYVHALCVNLLEMLAERIATSMLASGTLSLLANTHKAMPTPDPVVQSRLCARIYERVLAHMLPLGTQPSRSTLALLASFLKLASNESINDVALQDAIFSAGRQLLDAAAAHPGLLAPRAAGQAAVALQRNVLHSLANADMTAETLPVMVFLANYLSALQGDAPFVRCVANRAMARLWERYDQSANDVLAQFYHDYPELVKESGLGQVLDDLAQDRSTSLDYPPFPEAWAVSFEDQAAFTRTLYLDRLRQVERSLYQESARAQGVLATHTRLSAWHSSLLEADRIKFGRFAQDLRDDLAYVRQAWAEASEALALQRGAPHDWQLDATEGPCRARIKLCPVPPSDAVPSETRTSAAMPAELAELAGDGLHGTSDAAVLDEDRMHAEIDGLPAPPPKEERAPLPPPKEESAPAALPDDVEDTYRCVLRSLKHNDTIEDVVNTSRVLGIEARSSLLVAAAHHLYLLDDYFQRPSGEIAHVWDVPAAERDKLIAAAFASAQPSDMPQQGMSVQHWRWETLRLCLRRAWLHRRTALELFFTDGRSCLLVLADATQVQRVLTLLRLKAPNALTEADKMADSVREAPQVPQVLAKTRISGAVLRRSPQIGETTRAWQDGRISNAAYLMALNTLAGRTMNDLTQFPVFPWVLADYTSGTLDLDAPQTFRDLSRPMGAQTEARRAESAERYQQLLEVEMDPFHYGTHYSTAASVCGFLVRLRPFAHWLVELQGGSFDLADRMFSSVGRAWFSASEQARGDVRELIPEFFFLPELFVNTNKFAFGRTQAGTTIDDVQLPPWAHDDPFLFVQRHREALESEYVSAHLHRWIDLVFGVQSRGQAAIEAMNVFHPLSYADSIDIEQIDSALEREAAAQVIHNFGQTPNALFSRPHPARGAKGDAWDVAATPQLLIQGRTASGRTKGPVHALGGLPVSVRGVAREQELLLDELLVLTYGHIDGSVRFVHLDDLMGRPVAVAEQVAPARITTLALVGTVYAVLGAEDGTVQLYGLHASTRQLEPVAVWSGHTAPVVCAAASATWSIVVTGSMDHTAKVWDVTRRRYVRTLSGHAQPVRHVAIDEQRGWIATAAGDEVCVYSINGHLLARQSTRAATRGALSSLAFCAREFHAGRLAVLLTGHRGQVLVWDLVSHHEETPKDAPRWRMSVRATLPARSTTAITALSFPTPDTLCTGDEHGEVYVWALPGAATTPGATPDSACMNRESCGKRFGFLEAKRACGSCGGLFCGACTAQYPNVGNVRYVFLLTDTASVRSVSTSSFRVGGKCSVHSYAFFLASATLLLILAIISK